MANLLHASIKEELRQRYLAGESIKSLVKALNVGRNTIRKLVRTEELIPSKMIPPLVSPTPSIERLDFKLLEKMYAAIREPGAAKDFESQIKTLTLEIGSEHTNF